MIDSLRRRSDSILALMRETAAAGAGGEASVRSGRRRARLFFVRGKLAWVSASHQKSVLSRDLAQAAGVTEVELAALASDCKQTGRDLMEELVRQELIAGDVLRRVLLQHMSSGVGEILRWHEVETTFLRRSVCYDVAAAFDVEEIVARALPLPFGDPAGIGAMTPLPILADEIGARLS